MPQWRKFHAKSTESLDINDMPDDFTRLLWVMLPLKLCREGRGMDSAAWVRSNIFPLREDVTLDMVTCAMDWYTDRGMIVRYQVEGRRYFYVPTWERHQGNTSKETESIYPPPPTDAKAEPDELTDSTPELVQSNAGVSPALVPTNSSTDADADADTDSDAEKMQIQKQKRKNNAGNSPANPPGDSDSLEKPTSKKKTPTPEAIKVFRQNANRYPAKSWYGDVAAVVGRDPPDLERWGIIVKEWVGNGWNPTNVRGMLDKFQGKTKDGTTQENGRKVITVS